MSDTCRLFGRQINPRQSKEIQTKKLGFPWIPLAELGLFNGLRRFQIKKFSLPFSLSPTRPAGSLSGAHLTFLPSETLA
jgi:hypothetical protein